MEKRGLRITVKAKKQLFLGKEKRKWTRNTKKDWLGQAEGPAQVGDYPVAVYHPAGFGFLQQI